uniref:H/ACA ribonucleoprotein complex subunit n=1 Tax=Heligmosomoides polygyrus TaxID=6339 RepID=A0A183GFY1_HELPZ
LLENLTIHCEETVRLEIVGHVVSVVDCLVVIQSDTGVALDFDSVLFDRDRNSIGVVYDLFGPVRCPYYSVSEIPSDECISDEIVFSDDEKEKEYRMRKSAAAAAAKRPDVPNDPKRGRKRNVQFSQQAAPQQARGADLQVEPAEIGARAMPLLPKPLGIGTIGGMKMREEDKAEVGSPLEETGEVGEFQLHRDKMQRRIQRTRTQSTAAMDRFHSWIRDLFNIGGSSLFSS